MYDAKRPLPSVLQLSPAGQYVASQDVHRDRDEATSGDQIDGQTDEHATSLSHTSASASARAGPPLPLPLSGDR